MPEIDCERCGERFDTERDAVPAGADTTRCPSCGQSHDVEEPATDGGAAVSVPAGERTVIEVHIHVHHE